MAAEAVDVDYGRIRRWVIKREGKDYVQYAGLLDLLHQESKGDFAIATRLEQAPTEANGGLAVVSATVTMGERTASGLGDASEASVNRMMAPHLIRLAETRAKGRALRDLLNIGLVTVDELGPGAADEAPARSGSGAAPRRVAPPARATEDTIDINGTTYTRDEVLAVMAGRMKLLAEQGRPVPPVGEPGGPPPTTAPLPELVKYSADLRRQAEPRAVAGK